MDFAQRQVTNPLPLRPDGRLADPAWKNGYTKPDTLVHPTVVPLPYSEFQKMKESLLPSKGPLASSRPPPGQQRQNEPRRPKHQRPKSYEHEIEQLRTINNLVDLNKALCEARILAANPQNSQTHQPIRSGIPDTHIPPPATEFRQEHMHEQGMFPELGHGRPSHKRNSGGSFDTEHDSKRFRREGQPGSYNHHTGTSAEGVSRYAGHGSNQNTAREEYDSLDIRRRGNDQDILRNHSDSRGSLDRQNTRREDQYSNDQPRRDFSRSTIEQDDHSRSRRERGMGSFGQQSTYRDHDHYSRSRREHDMDSFGQQPTNRDHDRRNDMTRTNHNARRPSANCGRSLNAGRNMPPTEQATRQGPSRRQGPQSRTQSENSSDPRQITADARRCNKCGGLGHEWKGCPNPYGNCGGWHGEMQCQALR